MTSLYQQLAADLADIEQALNDPHVTNRQLLEDAWDAVNAAMDEEWARMDGREAHDQYFAALENGFVRGREYGVPPDTMSASPITQLQELFAELADIERQLENKNLSHSDQQLLDQAWEDVNRQIEELDDLLAAQVQDAEDAARAEWDDDAPQDCGNCAGCAYCMEPLTYDGSDEA